MMSHIGNPTPIAVIDSTSHGEVRVALGELQGKPAVDIRIYTDDRCGGHRTATKRGVSFRLGKLDDLIAALEKARAECVRLGWLS